MTAKNTPYFGIMLAGWASLVVGYKYSSYDSAFWIMNATGNFNKFCHADNQGNIVWD